jgi:hypothetical protein
MIKQWMQWMAGVMACVWMLAACGGGGGSPGSNPNQEALSVGAVTALTLMPGEARELPVSGGVPPYRVVSAEQTIAVATLLNGNRLIIGGQNAGSTQVTVSDHAGKSVQLAVRVADTSIPLYTTAPAALSIGVGPTEARTFRVAGGVKPYVITGSAPLVATVTQLDAEQWRIQGVAIGEMKVRIRDAAGTELEVAVTVGSPELRISTDQLTLPIGIPATVVLSGGQKPYSIAGGIPAAIQVRPVPGSDSEFEILGLLATGDVDVVFSDVTGKTVKTKVTINTGTTQIRVSPSTVTLAERSGSAVRFNVFTAARGNLTVFSSNPGLVSISAVTNPVFNPDGTINTFGSFVGTVSGTTCVATDTTVILTVLDSNGSVGTATVTVVNVGNQSDTNPCP